MDVAEGKGARRKKISCAVQEIFLHGADGGGATASPRPPKYHRVPGTL